MRWPRAGRWRPEYEYDLGGLGRAGAELRVEADAEQRARIAAWADVGAVEAFGAAVKLTRAATDRFVLDATLTADIVQDCVVTLEPVRSHIERVVHRELHLAHRTRFKAGESPPPAVADGEDDVPEEIESPHYDLAAPLLEELVLAIDLYPRAPGVEFAAPAEPQTAPESPFAVLKSLKNRT
jgi:uncharacterized metal-binding protein YceD (DUF177 family)